MLEEIRELVAYDDWAGGRLLEAVGQLSPEQLRQQVPSSFPSVLATLQHVITSDAVWFRRWQGVPPEGWPTDLNVDSVEALRARWTELRRERAQWLAGLTDDDLRRDFPYVTTRGEHFSHPLVEQLRHVVNHATYHRGQVITMLHQLGAATVNTDLIAFYRSPPSQS